MTDATAREGLSAAYQAGLTVLDGLSEEEIAQLFAEMRYELDRIHDRINHQQEQSP